MGTCYAPLMYVVGAHLLSEHCRRHAHSRGELRALHALLAATDAAALEGTLANIATLDGNRAEIALRTARVGIELNRAAGVARYTYIHTVEDAE